MTERSPRGQSFDVRLPLLAGLVTFAVLLPITIYNDFDQFLFILVAGLAVGLVLLVISGIAAVRRRWMQSLAVLSMLAVFCGVSWIMARNSSEIRADGRWLLWAKKYKAQALAQDPPKYGELQHMEWDVYGWVGMDTTVYLVFDPNDSLAAAARSRTSGKFKGIPCEVPPVHRLERH